MSTRCVQGPGKLGDGVGALGIEFQAVLSWEMALGTQVLCRSSRWAQGLGPLQPCCLLVSSVALAALRLTLY